jgi:hypothetical protein
MKARYIAVYKLHGANKLAEDAKEFRLAALTSPALSALLTADPESYFLHIDRWAALASQLFKGLFDPQKQGTPEERVAAETAAAKARRAEQTSSGVFLVLEGDTDIPDPAFKARRDLKEFALCLDDVDRRVIRETFRPTVQIVLAALGLALPENADRRIEKIGDAVHLVDPDTGKPIYVFTIQFGSPRLLITSPLSREAATEAAALAVSLAADKTMARPVSLLTTSLDGATGELQAFIAAWSALEMFVNASFKTTYEAHWFKIMEEGAPSSAKPVLGRFKEVMSDKYRLSDKFLVIASVLVPASAAGDHTEFARLKKFRDGLFHALDGSASPLPTHAVQKLLLKYMRLHLAAQG